MVIFNYFMWFLYTAAVCGSLFRMSGEYSRQLGYSGATEFVIGALWLVLSGLLVFGISKYIRKNKARKNMKVSISFVTEGAIAIFLLAIGIFLRFYGIDRAGEYASYFETAMVADGRLIPAVVHGAVYLYLQLLHLVLFVFGNHFFVGIILQIVLQILGAIFFYFAVRKQLGVFAAQVMLGFIMIGSSMVEEALNLSPRMMLFAIYALVFLIVVTVIRNQNTVISYVFAGILTSAVCYLDVIGISLLIFAIAGMCADDEESATDRIKKGVVYGVSCAVGFILLMWVDSLISSAKIVDVLNAWIRLFTFEKITFPWEMEACLITWDIPVLVLMLTVGIFSFWCGRKDRQSLWMLMAFSLLLLSVTGISTKEIGIGMYLYIAASVLTAVGMMNVVYVKDSGDELVIGWEKSIEAAEQKVNEGTDNVPQVQYIENPLPLPKKHVKKVLDFDREVPRGKENYDIRVADDDDFDI